MTQSTTTRAGRFHQGRLADGRPQALDAWRVTTADADVAARVAGLLGGEPQPNEGGGGGFAYEVLTSRESVRVLLDGPDAVAAHMVLRGSKGIVHECDGVEFLSPEEKKGQPCGCPPLLADRKVAARDGRGPTPSVDITFQIAAAPKLGTFHFMTGSWMMAAQLSELTDALERVGGPAVCDLTMELVVYTTKSGRGVCYRKPVVTVLGSPDNVAPEPPPSATPAPTPVPSAHRHGTRPAPEPEPTTPSAPDSSRLVSVDAILLRRAAQVLGTGDHQETVIAALSEIVAGPRQAAELARLRDQVGRIAAIAEQALRGRNSSLT
ncbi:SlyX family protein [Streptomyces qinzhouensis]|uniref:SlyX family protein n=1 Tax=Streptomyces qinzhouensis TaxID=2599401 RepID=A0A5B8JGW0_9ACTN|nr:SlyX family protein [Streptomyces qinzhouensis]